ncbi:Dps family protein [Tardiphaga sp. 862_B3_N1_1]|uniref:Dps family protein n=1 Tax=Tardiphaga sp. 862_B3_N1_1 TaxID=3240763 RepID=UPI003F8B42C3
MLDNARLRTPLTSQTDLSPDAVRRIPRTLRILLADVLALYVKIKNFYWHMSGAHVREYHLMLDEHGDQVLAMVSEIAERARKLGGSTIRSVGDIVRYQTIADNDADYVSPRDMLAQLCADNQRLTREMRAIHRLCGEYVDFGTASALEKWIDETERRTWFLFEASQSRMNSDT